MSKSKYSPQKWNSTAVNTLRAWLTTVGVQVQPSAVEGFDLVLKTTAGQDLEVLVGSREDETLPGPGMQVVASTLTGKKLSVALREFWRITDAAGYERRNPLNRGEEVVNENGNRRKLHVTEEPFLVGIRHAEFRRAVDPAVEKWKQYRQTIEEASYRWLNLNYSLCGRHGLSAEDLMQYARCYLVNFVTRYETTQDLASNQKLLYKYIWQRFRSDLRAQLERSERSTLPDYFTADVAGVGDRKTSLFSGGPENSYIWALDHEDDVRQAVKTMAAENPSKGRLRDLDEVQVAVQEVDYDYVARHCELNLESKKVRRDSAAAKLQQLLDGLPRDKMVEVLEGIIWHVLPKEEVVDGVLKITSGVPNQTYDFATRKEARLQLKLRGVACRCDGTCASCTNVARRLPKGGDVDGGLQVEEEVTGLDPAGCVE